MLVDLYNVFIFFSTGALIGILFDVFRILRKSFKTANILTYIEDILFWILTGLLIIYVVVAFTDGEIRLYMIVMLIVGAILYFMTISKYFVLINSKILLCLKWTISKVFQPFVKIYKKFFCKKTTI